MVRVVVVAVVVAADSDAVAAAVVVFCKLSSCLWSPYIIGQTIYIFILSFVLSFFFSSPNLSSQRLDVYHTFTHGVALVHI